MKIEIIKFGKPAFDECAGMVALYQKRLERLSPVSNVVIKVAESDRLQEKSLTQVLNRPDTRNRQRLVCLDERGQAHSTKQIAEILREWRDQPTVDRVTLVVGGPYGVPKPLLDQADLTISFGPATFPSDIAWLLTWEQVYRSFTLILGLPYHHS